MQQVDLKAALKFKDFFHKYVFHKIFYLIEQIGFKAINSDIADWSAYVSYVIQPIRAQIDFNQQITDVRMNYLK